MHDPSSLFRFAEHDVYLPMMTLEELDSHKKGMSEVSRNARQVSRSLDALIAAAGVDLEAGERPQAVVPGGAWQSAKSLGPWTLVGCTVAPGFEFARFEIASPGILPEI